MAGRLTVCNMSIEAGARAGLVAPDEVTFAYLEGRPHAAVRGPRSRPRSTTGARLPHGTPDASFDNEVVLDAATLTAVRDPGAPTRGRALGRWRPRWPDPDSFADPAAPGGPPRRALTYMDLNAGHRAARRRRGHGLRRVLHQTAGSRDLRAAASVLQGRHVAPSVHMLVVPGSMAVRAQAEREGLDAHLHGRGAPTGGRRAARCASA